MKSSQQTSSNIMRPLLLIAAPVFLLLTVILFFIQYQINQQNPSTYEECITAKKSILQGSYPPACITQDGERFVPPVTANDKQAVCEQNGGVWLETYSECEGIDPLTCEQAGGVFDECASNCRHDPAYPNVYCIQLCVPVCTF